MIREIYREVFGEQAMVEVKSPGRINVIGEHTDYNQGFVMPAAIDRYGHVAAGKREDDLIRLYAKEYHETYEVRLSDIAPVEGSWTNFILGVVDQLVKRGDTLGGFNLALTGDVPVGAGLSSSAAIECAVCMALNELFQLGLQRWDIVKISQLAEHTYPGVQCGIMDQFASVFGKKDHALQLDCRSLEYKEVPLVLEGYKIVLLNTNVKHSLASTAYNKRRMECAEGVEIVNRAGIEAGSLRDVTVSQIEQYVSDPVIKKRCRFIVEENARVQSAMQHMQEGNIDGMGELLFRSHQGLSSEYEVSCPELDWLVEAVRHNPLVAGARMMGGGFGGCTINFIREKAITELVEHLALQYEKEMGKKLTVYIARTSDGTAVIG